MSRSRKIIVLGVLITVIGLGVIIILIAADVIMLGPIPILKTARNNPMQYYVSPPDGWTPYKKWPILVTVNGANHSFFDIARTFVRARNNLPFIIVAPIVLSTVNIPNPGDYSYPASVWDEVAKTSPLQFDDKGLAAVISDVQADYNGEDKFFITGWSGGGNLAWFMVFTHPEKLAGAALAAGNFHGRGIGTVSSSSERFHLSVKGFQGDQDQYYNQLTPEWLDAKKLADANGYQNVTYQIIAGADHQPFADQVLGFFASLLPRQN